MARIRTIKPELWKDDKFIDLSTDTVRLFFLGLLNHVDDDGRAPHSPREIRREIFPDRVDLDASPILEELDRIGLVVLYEVDGKRFLAIRNFAKHQKIDRKTPSRIPAPPSHFRPLLDEPSASDRRKLDESPLMIRQIETTTQRILDEHSMSPRRVIDESSTTEGKGMEWNGKEGEGEGINRAPDPDFIPDNLDLYQYAKGLLELIRLPATRALQEIARSSIETLAKAEGMDHARATELIRKRALAAKKNGITLDRFWFEDGSFNYAEGRKPDGQPRKSRFAAESEELRRRVLEQDADSMAD